MYYSQLRSRCSFAHVSRGTQRNKSAAAFRRFNCLDVFRRPALGKVVGVILFEQIKRGVQRIGGMRDCYGEDPCASAC